MTIPNQETIFPVPDSSASLVAASIRHQLIPASTITSPVMPLITLPENTYNKSFGGDPAPGSTKQLKVQYKINGKPGEATFAEGALIVLPTPK